MPERHYTENEVAEIFKLATDPDQPARSALPPGEGMTLAQLQDIGREAGIASERVALIYCISILSSVSDTILPKEDEPSFSLML